MGNAKHANGNTQSTRSLSGAAVQEEREALGLSQRQLADLADVNHGYLSEWENGKVEPKIRWQKAVTDALGNYMAAVQS